MAFRFHPVACVQCQVKGCPEQFHEQGDLWKHDKTDMGIGRKNILVSWIGAMTMEKYQFTPDNNADPPYQITINMDNKDYIFRVMYNLYSQRWYFSISDLQQNVIKIAPLISSTENREINLTFNLFFNNSLVFRNDQNMIMVK